ncbi:hypothetical protein EI94DRAFT_1725741 [Lactarius quietus]|nr:hypothetical protein EI94DRAFT_1725741 [Lactarius quietus]
MSAGTCARAAVTRDLRPDANATLSEAARRASERPSGPVVVRCAVQYIPLFFLQPRSAACGRHALTPPPLLASHRCTVRVRILQESEFDTDTLYPKMRIPPSPITPSFAESQTPRLGGAYDKLDVDFALMSCWMAPSFGGVPEAVCCSLLVRPRVTYSDRT